MSKRRTCLVVEDDTIVRTDLVSAVEDAGLEPLEASDADCALQLLQGTTEIHLLLTDIRMPGLFDGQHLIHAARKLRPEIRLLVVTGASLDTLSLPADIHVLAKPYSTSALLTLLQALKS